MLNHLPDHDTLYEHILRRDPELDGVVYVGVKTTGIFCRPVCPARTPLSKNIIFYSSPDEAIEAGFRPCKRCRPLDDPNAPGVLLDKLLRLVEEDPSRRWSEDDLREMGIEPATARRQFQKRFDMSFSQYARARRLGHAFNTIRKGDAVIEAQLDAGFESGSGFREAFSRQFGEAPAEVAQGADLRDGLDRHAARPDARHRRREEAAHAGIRRAQDAAGPCRPLSQAVQRDGAARATRRR